MKTKDDTVQRRLTDVRDVAEQRRLAEAREGVPWRKWGPYLSERQWGTVREDYSDGGDAWSYFGHDQARSRAYRWGEDGLAGFSDDQQRLCFGLALWNGKDPILKERLFGLTNGEGNHGEDVKEYYFYLDSTPTHSYMKWLYKYPQREYPYLDLLQTNRRRSRSELEYELLDTGVFKDSRYFDVFVEYAKASPEDIYVRITAVNRGPEPATLDVLPTLWFRNTWAQSPEAPRPELRRLGGQGARGIAASHAELGARWLYVDEDVPLLFTENDTNVERVFGRPNPSPYVKDGINNHVVQRRKGFVNPEEKGTKAAAHHRLELAPGETRVIRLRLTEFAPERVGDPFSQCDSTFEVRLKEADELYAALTPPTANEDEARVMREAIAGMLWSKQFYNYDVDKWLAEHGIDSLKPGHPNTRNGEWGHMVNAEVISMPDKWEYPWYAGWDLGVPLHRVRDHRHRLRQATARATAWRELHPPEQPTAGVRVELRRCESAGAAVGEHLPLPHRAETAGGSDIAFLKHNFGKLHANFTWWVNRKDRFGKNVFEGGFLGMDNIGVFDRSAALPTGGNLEQADGTAWVALFCQNMLEIAVEIATEDPTYEDLAVGFVDHFLLIANAMNRLGPEGMWDEEDGFYYDVLRFPDGSATRLKVRSMVGLLPLCATTVIERWQRERVPRLVAHAQERLQRRPELLTSIHAVGPEHQGVGGSAVLALVSEERLRRILARMLDEKEFLSPYGIRSLSAFHRDNPYVFRVGADEHRVSYQPAESDTGMFGGNSNWRGPIWMPMNALLIRALLHFYSYYGDNFRIECPTGSGNTMNLYEVAHEISSRLVRSFLRDESGKRPVHGGAQMFQEDPHWRDLLLYYEYFHGDNGAGIGASHQTGWTGLIATLIQWFGFVDAKRALERGAAAQQVKASSTPSIRDWGEHARP